MLARDVDSNPTQYRTWVVPNTPDLTGQYYTGLKSGPNALVDISAYSILDSTVIADFNLPLGPQWQPISSYPFDAYSRKVLPGEVSDGQLVIIDGYAYLFGGQGSNKIYRASLNNPGNWMDTGFTLPTVLVNSSLAIVNGYIYLFGGNDGYNSIDNIYSAPTSDPLNWTDTGFTLPNPLDSSSLAMGGGFVYLFGGQVSNHINSAAQSLIYQASTSDLSSWSVSGNIPVALYGSTIAQSDGYWYLLGGQTSFNTAVKTIYQATIDDPTTWIFAGNMPYNTSYGAYFPVGQTSYYIGPSPGDARTGFTTILQSSPNGLGEWFDTTQVVPAVISHSQSAIIYDRLWFFGGSGLSAIFTCDQLLKYDYHDPTVVAYGNDTRTIFQSTDNTDQPFLALGMPYWRTDY